MAARSDELIHQLDESNDDIAAVAGLVAMLHLSAAAMAASLASGRDGLAEP